MNPPFKKPCPSLLVTLSLLLAACGGGGGGSSSNSSGGGSSNTSSSGSLAIAEVDSDHDGLIEIATLEQLDWIRNNPQGTSLIDFKNQANLKGCPTSGCFGYELVADLDFDTNGDGVLNSNDKFYDYEKNGGNGGWLPIPLLTGSFEGNGHHIRNLFINRTVNVGNASAGLFAEINTQGGTARQIQNIIFDGPLSSITGIAYAGALAGEINAQGTLTISHITHTGNVVAIGSQASGGGYAGGIIGSVNSYFTGSTLIIDSNTTTSVVNSSFPGGGTAGGLIGGISAETLQLTNNSSSSNVSGARAGGLIGALAHSLTATATITGNSSAGTTIGGDVLHGLVGVGGLVGTLSLGPQSTFRSNYSTTSVTSTGDGDVGGLIGLFACMPGTFLDENYASGDVTAQFTINNSIISGGSAGGLVGSAFVPASGTCGIKRSFAAGSVVGGRASGGIIGAILPSGNVTAIGGFEITENFSSGAVNAYSSAGGIAGDFSNGYGGVIISVLRNFAVGHITASTTLPGVSGGIVGRSHNTSSSMVTLGYNHWAFDTTTATTAAADAPSVVQFQLGNLGATRAQLECPLAADNLSCAPAEIFHSWDAILNSQGQPVWNFGDTAQLPGLKIGNAVYRPTYNNGTNSYSVVVSH